MRETKFRAFAANTMGVVEYYNKDFCGVRWGDDEVACDVATEDIEIMQFTGLLDKNGIEIYEGDVVTHRGNSPGVVIYQQYVCQFILQLTSEGRGYAGWFEYDYMQKDGEVIGNIYEHPELLAT